MQERREFRTIIEQFRYTNTELYQKMAQAGETRNSALFNKKAKWKLALVLPSKSTSNDNKGNSVQPSKESPILKIKSKSGKGKFIKKRKNNSDENKNEKKIEIETVEDVLDDNDEVIQSLRWAHETLLKEHKKRLAIRATKGSMKRRAHKKLQTMWAFHHQNEQQKKAKPKQPKEDDIYTNMNKKEDDDNKKEEKSALIDDVKIEKVKEQVEEIKVVEKDKRKTVIINLQKRLSFKKTKRGQAKEIKTEEDKLNAAKAHLAFLQEKQKENIIVDFFGVPKGTKAAFSEVVKSLSRHGSEKSSHGLSRNGSAHSTHGDKVPKAEEDKKGKVLRVQNSKYPFTKFDNLLWVTINLNERIAKGSNNNCF